MLFYKNTNPQECKIFYYKKFKGFDYDVITKINWDEDKKITSREKIELMQKLPPLVTKLSKPTIKERKLPAINLNAIKDQKILEVLRRTEKICSLKNIHEFITNAQSLPLFNKKDHPSITIRLVNNELQHIAIFRNTVVENRDNNSMSYWGYYLSFKNNKLRIYAEGNLPLAFTKYYDATAKDNTKIDNLSIDGNGIEIKFHSNGYPASYHKIVRNRLYGRQIEWNDKGEVISDVDLDIPKEWKDAPRKTDKTK